MTRIRIVQVVVVVVGLSLAVLLAAINQMDVPGTVQLTFTAVGAAAVAGLLGVVGLRLFREGSLGIKVAIIWGTVLAATAVGAWAAAQAMFLSAHDLAALGVVLIAAGTVAATIAMGLSRRFGNEGDELVSMARAIGREQPLVPDQTPQTRELATLAQELDRVASDLESARRRQRALESSRRELVAWVSHDLRTPLAAIRAVAEALEDQVVGDPDEIARYHKTLREEADRLTTLVDDLFELSRTQAGVLQMQLERVPLHDVVSDAVSGVAPIAEARGVRLDGDADAGSPPVELSPRELTRALRNVLENAIRHTPAEGTVQVRTGTKDGAAYVTIEDGCGGIPETNLDRVFDVAFRGEEARTPGEDGGAGLGLAIARGIIEAHHGEISVANIGPGCRFLIRLRMEQTT